MKGKAFQVHNGSRLRELEGKELAGFGRRAVAFTMDVVICFVLFLLALALVGLVLWYAKTGGAFTTYSFNFDQTAWYGKLILNILIPVFYFAVLTWLSNGRTIGKKLLGIRVVSLVSRKITLWNAIERSLGYAASMLECGIGFLQYFSHPNHRTSQDCLAETIVIRD